MARLRRWRLETVARLREAEAVEAARALAAALAALDDASRRLGLLSREARGLEDAARRAAEATGPAGPLRGAVDPAGHVAAERHRAWLRVRADRLAPSVAEAVLARASLAASAAAAARSLEAARSAREALARRRWAWEAGRRASLEAFEEGEAEDARGGRRPGRRP